MTSFFAIAPWEHPGAAFDPAPHAITRVEVGGKKRTFWLKMRDGVIFFRESARVPVFAVPHLFAPSLADDPDNLIAEWKREVSGENYGAFIVSHRLWQHTPASANYCLILRSDGTGWMKEHFDESWQEFPASQTFPLDLWRHKPAYGDLVAPIIHKAGRPFLERLVEATHFQSVAPHWSADGVEGMISVLRSAAQLWLPPEDLKRLSRRPIQWSCKSNSAFWAGSVSGHLTRSSCYQLNLIWNIAKWHYGFLGVEWKKASDCPELQAKFRPSIWKSGFEQWGENWRGNWVGRQYEIEFSTPPLTPSSHHDKLEAALTLREWLTGKMTPQRIEALLQNA